MTKKKTTEEDLDLNIDLIDDDVEFDEFNDEECLDMRIGIDMDDDISGNELLRYEREKEIAAQKRQKFESNLGNVWGHGPLGLEAKTAAMRMISTKTGMYAKIPIVCKANECPYNHSCMILKYDMAPEGEFCPVEAAEIEMRYAGYQEDFNLETEASFTDRNLVNDIIMCDILMQRCISLMSKEKVPVIDVISGIASNGDTYTAPVISKYWEVYEKTKKKRDDSYQLLVATRKDKMNKKDKNEDSYADIISEALNSDTDFIDEDIQDAQFVEQN